MQPHDEEQMRAIRALEHTVTEIRTTLNNGLKSMVQEQKAELAIVKSDIQRICDALTSHVAKEDVVYEIFKRVNTGVSITGALIELLLAIICYVLVNPVVGLHGGQAAGATPAAVFSKNPLSL